MHLGPLGVLLWFLGGVLNELFHEEFEGDDTERVRALWVVINDKYDERRTGNRLSLLTKAMLNHGPSNFSCLSAKAGESLALLDVLGDVCAMYNKNTRRDRHRLACFSSLSAVFSICKAHGYFIPPAQATEMLTQYERFLVHYKWLAQYNMEHSILNYNLTFKFH